MNTRLLFITLLMALCGTQVYAAVVHTTKADPNEGEFRNTGSYTTNTWTGTFTAIPSSDLAINKITYDQELQMPSEPMKPGYTFMGWSGSGKEYLTARASEIYPQDRITVFYEAEFDGNDINKQPFTITKVGYGGTKSAQGITINLWAYMDDWSQYGTNDANDMRMISCKDGGGWSVGESNNSGKIVFGIYTVNGEGTGSVLHNITFDKTWSELNDNTIPSGRPKNWHMFTFTFRGIGTEGHATGYIDGVANNGTNYDANKVGGWIVYDNDAPLVVGGGPSGTDISTGHKFKGKIRYLSIMQQGFARKAENNVNNATAIDNLVKKWYANPGVVYADWYRHRNKSERTVSYTAEWKANSSTPLTFETNEGVGGGVVKPGEELLNSSLSQNAGMTAVVTEPTRSDYLFTHWSGAASDYTSLYQNLPILAEGESLPVEGEYTTPYFTRPHAGGISNHVTFPGTNANGVTYRYLRIDDSKYKYGDCFTVHLHARTDWTQMDKRRLVSCSDGGGWNIASDGTNIIFMGYDQLTGEYKTVNTSVSLEKLAEDTDHSFTYVFTGEHIHAYIDGKPYGTSKAYFAPMPYDEDNSIIIGAEANAGSNTTEDNYGYFQGEMWNFCILHTALSPSQVEDLDAAGRTGATDTKARYYHAPEDVTLTANWKALPLLSATATGELEKEFFLGDAATDLTFDISGNSLVNPSVGFTGENWSEKSSSITGNGTDAGSLTLTYTPPTVEQNTPGTHTVTVTVTEDTYSNPRTATATYKTYRKVAYDKKPVTVKHAWINTSTTEELHVVGDGHQAPTAMLDVSGPISIDVSGITKDGGTATLTYAPTAVGTHTINLTVDGNSAKREGNKLTETTALTYHAHQFEVVSWEANGLNVRIDEDLAKEGVAIQLNSQPITITKNADNSYFFPMDVWKYSSLGAQFIVFSGTESGVEWTLPTRVKVDYITGATSTSDAHTLHTVIVEKDAKLTHSTGDLAVNSLYVKAGGSFTTADAGKYTAQSVFLYSEGDEVPNVHIPSGTEFNVNDGTIHFVKRIPGDRWYFFSLPYDCLLKDIRFADGTTIGVNPEDKNSQDGIFIKEYDGAERVKNSGFGNGWVWLKSTEKLSAGVGYIVAINTTDPTNLAVTKDIVFPMNLDNNALHTLENPESKTVGVTAHGIKDNITPNHKGWNFVGNPFLAQYKYTTDEQVSGLMLGKLMLNDVTNDDNVYLTIPHKNDYYWQGVYSEVALKPFSAFFVQAGSDGSLAFVPSSRKLQSIVARRASEAALVYVGVTLSTGSESDATSLVVGNTFTQAYEIGSDLEKMLGYGSRPQVYVYDNNYQYAFKALNKADAAGVNTLGVYLPKDGEYTFALKDTYDNSQVQALYLTDTKTNVIHDLLQEPYTFTGTRGEDKNRFYLQAIVSENNIATDLTANEGMCWTVWQDGGLQIRMQGVEVGDVIRVVDMTGRLVSQMVASETVATFVLPTAGTYCLQTIGTAGVQAKKINVNY